MYEKYYQFHNETTFFKNQTSTVKNSSILSESNVKMIEIIRFITDLITVGAEIAKKRSVLIGHLRANKYVKYLRRVTRFG